MSVFTAYIDESGTHSDASNVVVAGYISTARKWRFLRREWDALLKREGVKTFHRADLESGYGEFKGWSKDRKESLIRDCHALIKQHTEKGLGAAVIASDFDKAMPDVIKRAFGGPYGWLVHEFMVGIGHWAIDSNQKGNVEYVFEDGADGRHQVERMFSAVFNPPKGLAPSPYNWRDVLRIGGWSFRPKYDDAKHGIAGTIQLQSADWFAYEIYKHMDNRVVSGVHRPVRRSAWDLFREDIDIAHYWDIARINKWLVGVTEGGLMRILEERERMLKSVGRSDLI